MPFRIILSFGTFLLFFVATAFAYAQVQSSDNGEKLERDFFKAVQEKKWDAVNDMIASYAQSINADKIRTRSELVDYIKSLTFENYEFQNFTSTKNGDGNIIVVTYTMTYKEKVNGEQQAGKQTKNLSVWEKVGDKWWWIAHAVID